ncbi:MAG: glycosyltransferase [Magnetococcales bacterium]|nr:glycosyltransferase [Magnetococcales bacterium]
MVLRKVGIVVPYYNRPEMIRECLKSLGLYAGHQVTVYIVDNSDDRYRILDGWDRGLRLDYVDDICVIDMPTECGVGLARNVGTQQALDDGCDLVFNFDDDAKLTAPNALDKIFQLMAAEPRFVSVGAIGSMTRYLPSFTKDSVAFLKANIVLTCFPRWFFEEHGNYDPDLTLLEDVDMSLRAWQHGHWVGAVHVPMYHHRYQPHRTADGGTAKKKHFRFGSSEGHSTARLLERRFAGMVRVKSNSAICRQFPFPEERYFFQDGELHVELADGIENGGDHYVNE